VNIGIDAKRIFFNHSGLGNYSRRFCLALAKNLQDDRFLLFSPKPVPSGNPYLDETIRDNVRIVLPENSLYRLMNGSVWRSALITKQLQKDKIDIYYGLSNEIPFGIKKLSMKKVVVIHDLIFLRYPELYPAADVFFYKKKTRYAAQYSDHIIAASGQTKQDIIDFYHVKPEKITVLYPCSASMFYQENVDDSSQFFKPHREYIISIGAITPRKNLLKTVMALNQVKDKFELDLVVIGTATGLGKKYLETIKDYISKHGLAGRVHFLGNVPYKFVPDLCRKAEMMVYPSQFEGFGMPIVEGLFSGIPVITSKGGCFPEAGGDAAIYVNPQRHEEIASWIATIMDSPELRKTLTEKGLAYAERFKQKNMEDEIVRFHKSVS
jgi:glycosyltransferase involved in cell wall biosynthesis